MSYPETLKAVMARVQAGRALVLVRAPGPGVLVHPVQPPDMDEDLQAQLWETPGGFCVAGCALSVDPAWDVTHFPTGPAIDAMAETVTLPILQYVSRPLQPAVHPQFTSHPKTWPPHWGGGGTWH